MTSPSRETGRSAVAATLFMVAALSAAGCLVEPEARTCPSGIYCPAGSKCAARQAICIFNDCGDGVLQPGEVCDDGNNIDGDGCSADCKSNETCGNGIVDVAMGEVCDDGNNVDGDGCSADCKSIEGCGNGKLDPGEDCDPGPSGTPNVARETSTCNSNCKWSLHGDGIVNTSAGELCDGDGAGHGNGRTCEWAGCNYDCTPSRHGDGIINPRDGEQCDGDGLGHGNGHDCESATCNADCTLSRHGDGIVNASAGEQCDGDGLGHGNGRDCESATCNANCTLSRHGDGIVNPSDGEQCDGDGLGHGNGHDCESATCNANCTLSRCGDGITNTSAGEQCDDGNDSDEDGCLTTCKLNVCGDGHVNRGVEECDLGARNGATQCLYGPMSCELCSSTCQVVLPATPHYCGDWHLDTNVLGVDGRYHSEECDNERSFACGTCGQQGTTDACKNVALQRATGTITVASTAVADGESFTIDDGINDPVTFEMDTNSSCQQTAVHKCVTVSGTSTTATIAASIQTAIAGASSSISSSVAGGGSQVSLSNTAAGINGNVAIQTSGSSGAIVVEGMTGGVGCPVGSLCQSRTDCVSNTCRSGTCKP